MCVCVLNDECCNVVIFGQDDGVLGSQAEAGLFQSSTNSQQPIAHDRIQFSEGAASSDAAYFALLCSNQGFYVVKEGSSLHPS